VLPATATVLPAAARLPLCCQRRRSNLLPPISRAGPAVLYICIRNCTLLLLHLWLLPLSLLHVGRLLRRPRCWEGHRHGLRRCCGYGGRAQITQQVEIWCIVSIIIGCRGRAQITQQVEVGGVISIRTIAPAIIAVGASCMLVLLLRQLQWDCSRLRRRMLGI